MITKH